MRMRYLVWVFIALFIGGVVGVGLTDASCSRDKTSEPDTVLEYWEEDTTSVPFGAYRVECDTSKQDSLSEDEEYQMPPVLPSFSRYEEEIDADSGYYYFSLKVDFPKSSVTNAKAIRKWLMNMIQKEKGDDKGMPNTHDVMMFSELYLPAVVYTLRFVTYRRFANDYRGGAHGMYTESFISFDHVHRQVIDYDYLFKPGSQNEVMTILIEEAKKTPQYSEWHPDFEGIPLPCPGLSEDGVVFSFQPYAISCFAAGVFHFTIPYERLGPLFTDRAKWCLRIKKSQ